MWRQVIRHSDAVAKKINLSWSENSHRFSAGGILLKPKSTSTELAKIQDVASAQGLKSSNLHKKKLSFF